MAKAQIARTSRLETLPSHLKGRIRRRSPGNWQISYELDRTLTLLARVSRALPK